MTSVHQQSQPITSTEKQLMIEYDVNCIPTNERLAICFCRGVALHLFSWVRECCIVYGPDGSMLQDLPSQYLVQIATAVIRYKTKAEEKNLEGVTNCSLALLTAQINNITHLNKDIHATWTMHSDNQSDSLELENQSTYRFEWKPGWEISSKWLSTGPG